MIHPQLVLRQVMLNAGKTMSMVVKVGKLFMSSKTQQRFLVCKGFDVAKGATYCPFASTLIRDPDSLPPFVGGHCSQCDGRCVGGVPNDFTGFKIDLFDE